MFLQITEFAAYVTAGLVAILLITIAFEAACESAGRLINNVRYASMQLGKKEIGRRISIYSYWFSENKEAFELMSLIGQRISEEGDFEINRLRDDWREKTGRKDSK